MPKETFFNLPNKKRELITKIAIEEFANNEYADVSISRLVARAGIAKGSFYQYFEDKEDLFAYLLDLIAQRKMEMFSIEQPDPEHIGIFNYLRWMAQIGVQFELTYPELSRLGYRALNTRAFPEEFNLRVQQQTRTFYKRLVTLGKGQKDIPPEIDEDLAAFVFDAIFSKLSYYLLQRVSAEQGNGWQGNVPLFEVPGVVKLFDQALDVLEHGLGRRVDS